MFTAMHHGLPLMPSIRLLWARCSVKPRKVLKCLTEGCRKGYQMCLGRMVLQPSALGTKQRRHQRYPRLDQGRFNLGTGKSFFMERWLSIGRGCARCRVAPSREMFRRCVAVALRDVTLQKHGRSQPSTSSAPTAAAEPQAGRH